MPRFRIKNGIRYQAPYDNPAAGSGGGTPPPPPPPAETYNLITAPDTESNEFWPGPIGALITLYDVVTINALGRWDGGGNGINDSTVKLWSPAGVVLAERRFQGTPSPVEGGYRYLSIPDLTLQAGQYILGVVAASLDSYPRNHFYIGEVLDGRIQIGAQGRFGVQGASFPNSTDAPNYYYVGSWKAYGV